MTDTEKMVLDENGNPISEACKQLQDIIAELKLHDELIISKMKFFIIDDTSEDDQFKSE